MFLITIIWFVLLIWIILWWSYYTWLISWILKLITDINENTISYIPTELKIFIFLITFLLLIKLFYFFITPHD